MTKATVTDNPKPVTQRDPGTAMQTVGPAQRDIVPDELLGVTEQDAGLGVSFKPEDQLLPLIYVLQTGSPVVDKRGDSYIEGAEPGNFWLRNSLEPIRDGEEGIITIPCEMTRTWIEWLPNRQGFVARHEQPPTDMVTRTQRGDDGRERQMLVRSESGNIIQDTREFYLLVEGQPFVLPCTSTKHTFARQWQTMFKQFRHPKTNDVMPAFSRRWKLTTVPASNAIGKWFGLKFEDQGWVTKREYDAGKALCLAVRKGERRAEAPVAGSHSESSAESDEIPF
jgi:hypothetical protein